VRGLPWTEFAESSDYILEVVTKEIPLTENLAFQVIALKGDKLVQFSGHP
jgi:hypothetical protein